MNALIKVHKDNFRILKFLHEMNRNVGPLCIMKAILEAAYPYINFIFTAFIIDALLAKNWRIAIVNVATMIIVQCLVGILSDIVAAKFESLTMLVNRNCIQKLCDHNLVMDYCSLENKENRKDLERAELCAANNGGFGMLMLDFTEALKAFLSILIAFVFIVLLCFETSTIENVLLSNLLSPIGSILIIGTLLSIMFMLYAKLAKQTNEKIITLFNEQLQINQEQHYLQDQVFMDYTKAKEIRLYKMKNMLLNLNRSRIKALLSFARQQLNFESKITISGTLLNDILNIFVYVFVILKVFTKAISVGSFIQFVSSFQQMNLSIRQFIEKTNSIMRLNTYLTYFLDFIEEDNKMNTGSLPIEKRNDNVYEIEFHNVSFHYPNTNIEVLKNISLKLTLKDKLACVGRNGAGKTTFIKLLCRLYEPSEGYISLNGIDIRKYDYFEYLKLFSVVFQDFSLFSFPLNENIACSMDGDDEKVWECIHKVGAQEKVESMSKQLYTTLFKHYEESGEEVSGGEAQKLAIARALYKDSPFVVLDEPTAALDPVSEFEIYSHFNELVNDKTSIFISHRMSSCRFCDDIIVFDQGKLIQRGNHQELMSDKKNVYATMWEAQAKYYT